MLSICRRGIHCRRSESSERQSLPESTKVKRVAPHVHVGDRLLDLRHVASDTLASLPTYFVMRVLLDRWLMPTKSGGKQPDRKIEQNYYHGLGCGNLNAVAGLGGTPMKPTLNRIKFSLSALLAGALMLVSPSVTLAQHRGGGGGGSHFSGGPGFSGGQHFSAPRGGGAQSFSGQRGFFAGQSFSGQRGFSGVQRGFRGRRDFDRDDRFRGGRFFRGGTFFGFGFGGYYPGYGYYPYYGAYCNPNGYYNQWGNWYPDPRCSNAAYYGGY
jgi:hypothetical protein